MFLIAAISLGFLGSFHCVGMCGPIALAIPVKRTSIFSVLSGSLVYNSGRVLTYSLIGLIAGMLGQGFAFAGMQNVLSVSLGLIIIATLFVPDLIKAGPFKSALTSFLEKLKAKLRSLFGTHKKKALFLIGMLNGLLPCGLVYLGLAGSIATGDLFKGALFMAGFGLGTLPAMLSVTLLGDRINVSFRQKIRKTIPVFVGVMALVLIIRGMNLGIPYLSPVVENKKGSVKIQSCHK
jgi:sulfite exporter TauE/SafE